MPRDSTLVFGASGFVGQAVVHELARTSSRLLLTSRTPPSDLPSGVEWFACDLLDAEQTARLVSETRPAQVVDCALARGAAHGIEQRATSDTLTMARNLASALESIGAVHLVHAGSQYEYGDLRGPHVETSHAPTTNTHGRYKRAVREIYEQAALGAGSRLCVLRIYSVYGPGEPEKRFIPTAIRRALNNEPIETTDDTVSHDFVFIDDVAAAFSAALETGAEGPFNIGSGVASTNPGVAREIVRQCQSHSRIVEGAYPQKERDRVDWYPDISRAERELGWSPKVALAQGIARSIEVVRMNSL
ncbi:MAG: NAD(P)-dependent oxidoreductase [Myxococcota bacterium]